MTRRAGISEEEARELWRRGAELQAQSELRRQALVPVDGSYSLEQVAAAAEGAGITADYVQLAYAEQQLPDAAEIRPDSWTVRWARRLLDPIGALETARSFDAAPPRVLTAVRTVFTGRPFELLPEDSVGHDPLRDGVLIFRLGSTGATSFHSDLNWADVRVLLVVIRADGTGTRVTLRVPLYRRGINVGMTSALSAGGAWGGAFLGTSLAGAITMIPAAVVLVPTLIGAAAGAVLGLRVYQGLYNSVTRSGEAALKRLLQAVALHVQAETDAPVMPPPPSV